MKIFMKIYHVPFLAPLHIVSVVHSDALPYLAKPETTTAREEGNQG